MEKDYIITVRNTYLVKADVDEDNPTPLTRNYDKYFEFKIANKIFFFLNWIIRFYNFLDKKFPKLFIFPKVIIKQLIKTDIMIYLNNIIGLNYPKIVYTLCLFYGGVLAYGMYKVDTKVSLFTAMISLYLTIFLLDDSKWYRKENTIGFSFLFGTTTFLLIDWLGTYITLPNIMNFCRLANIGNSITYICLFMTIVYLYKNKFKEKEHWDIYNHI